MPATFSGQLRSNEIFAALYNMIISQQMFTDNISGTFSELLDAARVDGSLYGDTKLYYANDVLKTRAWGNDSEAANLLALNRPAAPACQSIVLDQFRIVETTIDNYLSKRAWSTEGAFATFNGSILTWMNDTKRVYESTLYNSFLGTHVSAANKNTITVDLGTGSGHPLYQLNSIEAEDMTARLIGQAVADLIVDMKDPSRDFNDYKYLRSYNENELKFVTNAKWLNRVTKLGLPGIFHNEGLVNKLTANVLPARYFGTVITSTNISSYAASTATTGKPLAGATYPYTYTPGTGNANGTVRTLVECDVKVSSVNYHLFPADEIPAGATVVASSAAGASGQVNVGEIYIEQADVICKVFAGNPVPFMSAFEVATSFYNPKSLTENHYLIWGYNTLEALKAKPFITIKKA